MDTATERKVWLMRPLQLFTRLSSSVWLSAYTPTAFSPYSEHLNIEQRPLKIFHSFFQQIDIDIPSCRNSSLHTTGTPYVPGRTQPIFVRQESMKVSEIAENLITHGQFTTGRQC
jgi:hypothetical protein